MKYKYWPTDGSTERNDKLSLPLKNWEPFYLISAIYKNTVGTCYAFGFFNEADTLESSSILIYSK